jgi:hypothetical protein
LNTPDNSNRPDSPQLEPLGAAEVGEHPMCDGLIPGRPNCRAC